MAALVNWNIAISAVKVLGFKDRELFNTVFYPGNDGHNLCSLEEDQQSIDLSSDKSGQRQYTPKSFFPDSYNLATISSLTGKVYQEKSTSIL